MIMPAMTREEVPIPILIAIDGSVSKSDFSFVKIVKYNPVPGTFLSSVGAKKLNKRLFSRI